MKTINCIIFILLTSTFALSQGIIIEANASVDIELGADICVDSIGGPGSIIINGTFCGNPTFVDDSNGIAIPAEFSLDQNYPNPFNPTTTIRFSLPVQTQLKINIYNMLGELIKTLSEGMYEAGYYNIIFDAAELSSGTYIYRIESNNFTETKKMILIR